MENKGELAGQVSQLAQQSEAHRKASALQSLLEGQDPGLLPELPAPYTLVLMETGHALPALKQTYTDVSVLTYHQDGCEVVLFFGEERETVLAICREWADQSGVYCFCGSERTTFPQVAACYQVLREMRRQKFWAADRHCWLEEDFTPRRPHSSFTEQMECGTGFRPAGERSGADPETVAADSGQYPGGPVSGPAFCLPTDRFTDGKTAACVKTAGFRQFLGDAEGYPDVGTPYFLVLSGKSSRTIENCIDSTLISWRLKWFARSNSRMRIRISHPPGSLTRWG